MVVLVVVGIAAAALVLWLLQTFVRPGAFRPPRLVAGSPVAAATIAESDPGRERSEPTRADHRPPADEPTPRGPDAVELQVRERLYGPGTRRR